MIRTSDAPQAKSQAGTGRSLRPTSAWAEAMSGNARAAIGHAATRPISARRIPATGLRVDMERGDRPLGLVRPVHLDLEDSVEAGREREGHRAIRGRLLDLVAVDVDRALGLRQVDAELHLVSLVVGQRLHSADRIAARIDVQRLDAMRDVLALVVVVALE